MPGEVECKWPHDLRPPPELLKLRAEQTAVSAAGMQLREACGARFSYASLRALPCRCTIAQSIASRSTGTRSTATPAARQEPRCAQQAARPIRPARARLTQALAGRTGETRAILSPMSPGQSACSVYNLRHSRLADCRQHRVALSSIR